MRDLALVFAANTSGYHLREIPHQVRDEVVIALTMRRTTRRFEVIFKKKNLLHIFSENRFFVLKLLIRNYFLYSIINLK
jgi:hypothetical protein